MNVNKPSLQSLLNVVLPIIQAPMAGVQDSQLAISVCQAGGLGSLPCGMLSTDAIVDEIKTIKNETSQAFNLNFFCHQVGEFDALRHKHWRTLLKPYFTEFGGEEIVFSNKASRMPFNHDMADAIEPFTPAVISFHFGLPDPVLVKRIKRWGAKVLSTATTLDEALWLEANGADAIIVQGAEAGGHRGMFLSEDITTQVGLFSLLPQVINAVSIPVIAAGGIADRSGVDAVLGMGALAAQVGTAYLLCDEVNTSALHRQALKGAAAQHTAMTNIFSGRPARGIVNRAMKELGYMNPSAPRFPYGSIEMAPLKALAEKQGKEDFSSLWCGQNTSGCREISAGELTRQLADQLCRP